MPPDQADRRHAPRRTPQPDESLSRVKLRTGRELVVVNLSSAGALVEGLTRLLPGTRAEVHLVTRHGRVLVRTRIVRSLVWRLEPDVVCYRSALAFDTAVDTESPALSESTGPALSERSPRSARDEGESTGPALSERSPRSARDEGESNGYSLPAEIPSNHEAQGTHYPSAGVESRV